MEFDHSILRVFEVRAKAGQVEVLKEKLASTSIDVVQGEPGNLGYFFGELVAGDGDDLVFISVWQDLEAVKSRFGAAWQDSFLPEGYEALIESCSIRHIECSGSLGPAAD